MLSADMEGEKNKEFIISLETSSIEHEKEPAGLNLQGIKTAFKERESKLMSELQDAKDQAELLEFRVLELEEEQEKVFSTIFMLR